MKCLTAPQARTLQTEIGKQLSYLNRLHSRMKAVGLVDAELIRQVVAARGTLLTRVG